MDTTLVTTPAGLALGKRCIECGNEKPLSKFYKHPAEPDGLMRRCKGCHNGITSRNKLERPVVTERQWGDPSEEQIARATSAIRESWNAKTYRKRRAMAWVFRKAARTAT